MRTIHDTKEEFIDCLVNNPNPIYRFKQITPKTLMFQNDVDTIWVHIEHPQEFIYDAETDSDKPNYEPKYKVQVFSEDGTNPGGVINHASTVEIPVMFDKGMMWEKALQEVLHRF